MNIFSVLTVIFIVLKILGVINWHWLWVLSPMLILISFVILAAIVAVILDE